MNTYTLQDGNNEFEKRVDNAIATAIYNYDSKLSEFLIEHWPEKFGMDPATFKLKNDPSVLVSFEDRVTRRKESAKLEAAKQLLEVNGYQVRKVQDE